MKYQLLAIAAFFVSTPAAFPDMEVSELRAFQRQIRENPEDKSKRAARFNAKEQRISVDGEHQFVPPNFEAGDERGPCPGLNALANHGYLPHNGVADLVTIIKASNEVFGMAIDLATFLTLIGTVFDGNPLSANPGFSIGGPSKYGQNILDGLGLLGTPSGLSGSHNNYEGDVSGTRGDLYVTGNNYELNRERFIEYYYALREDTSAPEQYEALAPLHKQRFEESEKENPYFFFPPFAGVIVSPASYSFTVRMMANHSDEYPDGYLSRSLFACLFGVEGNSPDNFVVKQGWERIPENYYRRPIDNDFSMPAFANDILAHAAYYPRLLNIGGNTGKPDTFALVDIGDLTGGVFNGLDLFEGNNLMCFVLRLIQTGAPGIVGTMFSDVESALLPLTDQLQQLLAERTCPQMQKVNWDLFKKFPGYTKSYGTYPGAPKGLLSGVIGGIGGIVGGIFHTGK